MFTNFDDFFDYYIGEVRRQVPNYETFLEMSDMFGNKNGYVHIHAFMHQLTPKQIAEVETGIRNIIKIPKGVKLIYNRKTATYSSGYDEVNKKVMIVYPTVTYYYLQFPEIIKAAMQHEMGHILNKDIFTPTERSHSQCTNICMDARININIPHDSLDKLSRCLFKFKNEPNYAYINAEKFYEKIMLPFVAGGYSWEIAHSHYHWFDKKGDKGQPGLPGQPGEPGQGGTPMPSDIEDIMEIFGDHPGEDADVHDIGDEEGGDGNEPGEDGGGEDGQPGGKGGKPGDKTGKGGKGEKGEKDGKGGEGEGENGEDGEKGKGKGKGEGEDGTEKGEDADSGKGGLADETKKIREMIKLDKLIQKTISTLNTLKEKL